jgi:hypothetical protein
VGSRDGFELEKTFILPKEGAVLREILPMNDLHRSAGAHDISGQPDCPIGPTADAADQVVIRDGSQR